MTVVCKHPDVDFEVFMSRAKVRPGSCAWDIFEEIYWGMFRNGENLTYDFKLYYSSEFESFGEYLHAVKRLNDKEIKNASFWFDSGLEVFLVSRDWGILDDDKLWGDVLAICEGEKK